MIANHSKKIILDTRDANNVVKNLVVRDSLIVSDSTDFTTKWIGLNPEDVHAKASVTNTAKFSGNKDLVFSGEEKAQDVSGNGKFSRIRIENPLGVDVRGGGGFTVEEQLTVVRGELRNNAENNFVMGDTSRIIRHVGGSIAYNPELEKNISVHYVGDGDLVTGSEIPNNETALSNLYVNVTGKVTLDRNVSVMDSLEVGAGIVAIDDTLTLQGALNPLFTSSDPNVEIDGNFRRNTLLAGERIQLNHRNIWIEFESESSKGNTSSIVSNIRARKFHNLPFGNEKVRRTYILSGIDSDGNEVTEGIDMTFGFGWRHTTDTEIDESNGLVPEELVLQSWLENEWYDLSPRSTVPEININTNWATGRISNLTRFGNFALGMPGAAFMAFLFRANFYLEGPYIPGSNGLMTNNLWSLGMLSSADLSAYPTNLDPNMSPAFLMQIPDSVVDIVVLEFRKERNTEPSFVKTGFLKYDGTFVDSKGNPGIRIDTADGIQPSGGKYHVAVRHRNHSAVITEQPIEINKNSTNTVYNLSDPSMIEGGAASLKLVYNNDEGIKIYALKGGFLTEDSEGMYNQLNFLSYYSRNYEHQASFGGFTKMGYLNTDFNLSGIVNTKDFNITWNNRKAE
jgi:hypothetical protein